jgi:predicted metalloprotease
MLMGGNPGDVLNNVQMGGGGAPVDAKQEAEYKEFVGVILADTEDVWTEEFKKRNRQYRKPKLVLFSGAVDSACGQASAAVGPFYCGEDETVYIDLSFFDELKQNFGASGEFAQAYVVAHEVGHHVQKLLGTLDKVNQTRGSTNERNANELSVRLELQADFYSGVWAKNAQQLAGITKTDIQDGLNAANAIGDDTLQRRSQGQVVPDAFTHGTSEQRMRWFMKGYQSGRMEDGNTFNVERL